MTKKQRKQSIFEKKSLEVASSYRKILEINQHTPYVYLEPYSTLDFIPLFRAINKAECQTFLQEKASWVKT